MRLFIAINLPDNVRNAIGELVENLRAPGDSVRWTRPDNVHLTLKFLGEVQHSMLEKVVESLDKILEHQPAIELYLKNVGTFPNLRKPRIVWVGIGVRPPGSALEAIHADIDRGLASLGFEREERSFKPHLTIGRVKSGRGKGGHGRSAMGGSEGKGLERLLEIIDVPGEAFSVDSIELMESRLKPSGAKYAIRSSFCLKPPRDP